MRSDSHIHHPSDGRGTRRVLLDGRVVQRVVHADTRKGVVRHHDTPARIHKYGKRIIERTKRGTVVVEFI